MKYKSFPSEFSGPWELCFKVFSKCCIHFFDESSYKKWKLYCTALFILIHNITMWTFMTKIFTENINIFEVAYMFPVCVVTVQAISKAIIVLYRKPDIENLINELASIWRTENLNSEHRRIKKNLIKQLKMYHSIFYWSLMLGAWLHLIVPLFVVIFCRLFLSDDYKLALPFESVYPFDPTNNWIIYLMTYTFQAFTMFIVFYAFISSEFLMITFCGNLAIEFALLGEDLVHVVPFIKTDNVNQQSAFEQEIMVEQYRNISIEEFIRRHQHLIRLSMNLDDIFNGMILMNLLCITINACFFGFAITIAHSLVEIAIHFAAVVAMLCPLYIFCYYGELMKNESSGIADSAYNNPWYKGDDKFQRTIVLIILRSQRACCMTSWKQIPVTLAMFAKVSSTAWSYFSIVTSLYSSHEDTNSE